MKETHSRNALIIYVSAAIKLPAECILLDYSDWHIYNELLFNVTSWSVVNSGHACKLDIN